MTQKIYFFILISLITNTNISANTVINAPLQQQEETNLDKTDLLALETFSSTVNCMFNIVHKPHDKPTIISNISKIISGIFNFVSQMVAKNNQKHKIYHALHEQLQNILNEQHILSKNQSTEIHDGSADLPEIDTDEQNSLTTNMYSFLATINTILHDLYTLIQTHAHTPEICTHLNTLLEKIVQITAETMKSEYLHGNSSEEDFQLYLANLEELQEKIKHTILTHAFTLRDEIKK